MSTDATKSWPAYDLWTDEYLKTKYGKEPVLAQTKDDTQTEKLEDFLGKYRDETSSLHLSDTLVQEMKQEILLPTCLRCEEMNKFKSSLLLNGGNEMSDVHIETNDRLLCVLSGRKKVWFLFCTISFILL